MIRLERLLACAALAGCGGAVGSHGGDGGADAGRDAGFGPPPPHYVDGGLGDASWKKTDGGYVLPDAGVVPDDRFITKVVSFDPGPCGGFEGSPLPGVVEGPPLGGGACTGSTDVVSLGNGGSIVVSFSPNAIVDGPGPDFVVFENAFYVGCNPEAGVFAEPAEVSVSEDGVHWTAFPCTDTTANPPYGACAGVHPVFSNPSDGISPFDYPACGGDAYDLATLDAGVARAAYVRIVDRVVEPCAPGSPRTDGFDLDAIAVLHGER